MSDRVSDEVLSQLTNMVGPDSIYRAMATELIERRAEDDQAKDFRNLQAQLAEAREEIRELNQMGFTYATAAAQKAAMENAAKHDFGREQWFVYGAKTMTLEQIEKSQQEEKTT